MKLPKRFKFRISRVIPSFQSCLSREPSTVPSSHRLSFLKQKCPDLAVALPSQPPLPRCSQSSDGRCVSSAAVSVGCGLRSRCSFDSVAAADCAESSDFRWRKDEKWHVVAKIYDEAPRRKIYNSAASAGSDDDVVIPPRPPPLTLKRRSRRKKAAVRLRLSTSSADSGLFSSEGRGGKENDEETETLVSSSRSFSTDSSSEYNPHLETIREGPSGLRRRKSAAMVKKPAMKQRVAEARKRSARRSSVSSSGESETPARLSVFQRLIPCTVDGKVRESFAVVKKSDDPYEDFRRSMMDMILEKQMFERRDLEQLLHCFLSLNSRHHHGVIVEVFTEIWEALFRESPGRRRNSNAL
ncbi:hypothetical protein Nepgr_016560 [Nepenthes gracilis]|uniref:Transcription repressor n=1 Tax=Nepenthes gracilis TaxID=150966 RepID=A0AAD3SPY2_NEPGR|nr:hypothetical protein Nepgr_016560 [Nepenthes gracilis]